MFAVVVTTNGSHIAVVVVVVDNLSLLLLLLLLLFRCGSFAVDGLIRQIKSNLTIIQNKTLRRIKTGACIQIEL
jgi:hypothetical protein